MLIGCLQGTEPSDKKDREKTVPLVETVHRRKVKRQHPAAENHTWPSESS